MPTLTFTLPGLPETEQSLKQTPIVRSVAWLIMVMSFIGIASGLYSLAHTFKTTHQNPYFFIALTLLVFVFPYIQYLLAKGIRRGSKSSIDIAQLFFLISSIGSLESLLNPRSSGHVTILTLIILGITIYITVSLFKYYNILLYNHSNDAARKQNTVLKNAYFVWSTALFCLSFLLRYVISLIDGPYFKNHSMYSPADHTLITILFFMASILPLIAIVLFALGIRLSFKKTSLQI